MTDSSRRIAFLDYLRIFAFSSVIAGHTYHDSWAALAAQPDASPFLRNVLAVVLPLIYAGGAGVIVFFMVSGYIIFHVLQSETTGEFLAKRFFRIYPLYVTMVLLQYLLENPAALLLSLPQVLAQLSLLGDFFDATWSLGGVEWTLRLELLFYVFMAALQRIGLSSIQDRRLPLLLAALTLALPYLPFFPYWSVWTAGYLNLYAPFFFLGMGFYLAENNPRSLPRLPRLVLLAAFALLVVSQFTYWIGEWHPRWKDAPFAAIAVTIFAVGWWQRSHLTPGPWVLRISQLTYASYLLHAWLYSRLFRTLESLTAGPAWLLELLSLALLLIACALAVRWVEQPAIRFGQRWLATRRDGGKAFPP